MAKFKRDRRIVRRARRDAMALLSVHYLDLADDRRRLYAARSQIFRELQDCSVSAVYVEAFNEYLRDATPAYLHLPLDGGPPATRLARGYSSQRGANSCGL